MILSFADYETESLAMGNSVQRFHGFERVALRKLRQLQIAASLNDLRIPPGNHLKPLHGKQNGLMSIRINDKWRICFIWTESGPKEVRIVDYH